MIEMESDRQALYQIAREHGDIDGLLAALRRLTEHQYRLAHFHGIRKGFEFGFLRGWRAARMLDKSKEKGASNSVRQQILRTFAEDPAMDTAALCKRLDRQLVPLPETAWAKKLNRNSTYATSRRWEQALLTYRVAIVQYFSKLRPEAKSLRVAAGWHKLLERRKKAHLPVD